MEIGVWGDSITYGAGDSSALGWVGHVRKALFDFEEYDTVYDRGVCGDTTEDVLKRFPIEADSIEPDIIILALGMNDSKYPNGGTENKVSPDSFIKNMSQLISEAKSKTQKIFLVGLTEVNEEILEGPSKFKNETIRKYDSYLKEMAAKEGITFINMHGVLDVNTDLEDGLHPNARGYEKMAQAVLPNLK